MNQVRRSAAESAVQNCSTPTHPVSATSRATLFDNGDFAYFADVTPVCEPVGGYCLKISSRLNSAKDADAEQVHFKACLDSHGLKALAHLITVGTEQGHGK
ncbi:hypothetical protein [Rhodoferax lacus]|uniref:hypothetical protein n=1 Tax=Rhodoferax lacus TaxID=2184758 RepID=UPI0011C1C8AE|nr:hypothetical protein [Rhodoferax lacus]